MKTPKLGILLEYPTILILNLWPTPPPQKKKKRKEKEFVVKK